MRKTLWRGISSIPLSRGAWRGSPRGDPLLQTRDSIGDIRLLGIQSIGLLVIRHGLSKLTFLFSQIGQCDPGSGMPLIDLDCIGQVPAGAAAVSEFLVQSGQFNAWIRDLRTAVRPSFQKCERALRAIRIDQQRSQPAVAIVVVWRNVEALVIEPLSLFQHGLITLLFAHGVVSRCEIVIRVGVVRIRREGLLKRLDGLLVVSGLVTAYTIDIPSDG